MFTAQASSDLPDKTLKQVVEKHLSDKFSTAVRILNFKPAAGGCINEAGKITTTHGDFFLKWNDDVYPGMFPAEKKGLDLLRKSTSIHIPEVIIQGKTENGKTYILLEWIESGKKKESFWADFGVSLAKMHKEHTNECFGLDHDNYIGSLPQHNSPSKNWSEFFIYSRIEPQLKIARESGKIDRMVTRKFEKAYPFFQEIFPEEKPSLLHGDLWSGNFIVNQEGYVSIFDPAVYYGHREMEIAYTHLFGGFEKEFYEAYEQEFCMDKGFSKRIDYYNLYPLLVHVNLMGVSYVSAILSALKKF
jgi:protein-ribulosamine 3-kinase